MKCDDCKSLNLDKHVAPCSICEHRPHDIYTTDKFERVEPVVLVPEDWLREREKESHCATCGSPHVDRLGTLKLFHNNGRLERDIELRPLMHAVIDYKDDYQAYEETVIDVLRNLKPLNPDEP